MGPRMAGEEKPYRVYRSGRGRGKLPRAPARSGEPRTGAGRERGRRVRPPTSRRRRAAQVFAILLGLFLAWAAAWTLASYFSFRDGVKAANARLAKSAEKALTHQNGILWNHSTTILLLGTDHADVAGRTALHHTDSIMLVRTDPGHHRIYYLSIPRDLYVEIPGHGMNRINAAYQLGGAALAIRTVEQLTGLPINHVAVVDFQEFRKLIDEIGGITVDVPRPIQSNSFDCPYTAARCRTWKGWRFAKGKQHMNGARALVYTRIRENLLNPAENDLTRAARQQQVVQAISSKLASVGTFFDLPFIGGDLVRPLATDLSPGDFLWLAWIRLRSGNGRAVRCRLGGDPEYVGGAAVLHSSEQNRNVISMFTGDSAPQPPPPSTSNYEPGCVTGSRTLG